VPPTPPKSPIPVPPVLRVPLYGAIGPKMTIAVSIRPPVDNERVTVLSTDPSKVISSVIKPDSIVIQNQGDAPVGFTLLFTPADLDLPPPEVWRDLWTQVKTKISAALRGKKL